MKTHNERLDLLESMIDKISLKDVVSLLAEVASAKADHIRETWHDEELAEEWDINCGQLLETARDIRG